MCGPHSALGLDETERELWPELRERLRQPGQLMAVMRGVLGGDAEVAAVTAVTPAGVVRPLAILATPVIAAEIDLDATPPTDNPADSNAAGRRTGRIGDYPVEVLMTSQGGVPRPAAVLVSPWIFENLTLFTRKLWSRR
jgi:hypothetical protein